MLSVIAWSHAMSSWPQSSTLIPEVLASRPAARRILDKYGLHGCGGPEGPVETLAFFARAHDVPLDQLLAELRTAVDAPARSFPAASATTPPFAAKAYQGNSPDLADVIYRPFFKAGIATVLTLGAVWGA